MIYFFIYFLVMLHARGELTLLSVNWAGSDGIRRSGSLEDASPETMFDSWDGSKTFWKMFFLAALFKISRGTQVMMSNNGFSAGRYRNSINQCLAVSYLKDQSVSR